MDIKKTDKENLVRAREKLGRLVDEALQNGTPIAETFEIMEQCNKIDQIMLQRESESD